ncbi:MAG: pyroglutamyl-peptidase I [Chloroflexaceae bacterium]|nr:pyroglutamyl-peptidase I [Chloroflexaceae bacterium]
MSSPPSLPTPIVLLTGFEPFGRLSANPTQTLMQAIADAAPSGVRLHTAVLPVTYAEAWTHLHHLLRQHQPQIVVCTGLAVQAETLRLERYAHNRVSTSVADNVGNVPSSAVIVPNAPDTYPTTLPVAQILVTLPAAGIAIAPSDDAGDYVCNYVYFHALHHLAHHAPHVACGFVHVPPHATLPAPLLLEAMRLLVQVLGQAGCGALP